MKRITEEREARGWTRQELASRSKLAPSLVGQFESGRVIPYSVQLARLAGALGWKRTPEELLEEVES